MSCGFSRQLRSSTNSVGMSVKVQRVCEEFGESNASPSFETFERRNNYSNRLIP